jgi:hypothetical protein
MSDSVIKFPGLQITDGGYVFVCKVCGTLILSAVPPGEAKCAWCAWLKQAAADEQNRLDAEREP